MLEVLPEAPAGGAPETGERWANAIGEILLRLSHPQNLKHRRPGAIRARVPTTPAVSGTIPTVGVSQNKIGIAIYVAKGTLHRDLRRTASCHLYCGTHVG